MIIGIDVSKDKLDVVYGDQHCCVKNTKVGVRGLFKNKLKEESTELVVFEATGGYEKTLLAYLLEQEKPMHRADGFRVKRYAQSKGYTAKTDKIDAKILARYGEQEEIQAQEMTLEQLKLEEVSSRRKQLKESIEKEKNRLQGVYLGASIKRSIKREIKRLTGELKVMTAEVDKMIEADKNLSAKRELLQSAKGVGYEVSTMLVAELPELGKTSREAIASLCGVAPRTNNSGKKKGYASIGRGRSQVRKVMYMAALVAVRHDAWLKGIYEKKVAEGKKKKVVLVMIMRKMLVMLNAMLKNGEVWEAKRV